MATLPVPEVPEDWEPPSTALFDQHQAGNWHRIPAPNRLLADFPNARCWQREVHDGHLSVIRTIERATPQDPWRAHISISHRLSDGTLAPGRYPTWDEQREAVWRFAPGRLMASYLPPEGEEYVNYHPTTFHWWEVDDEELK